MTRRVLCVRLDSLGDVLVTGPAVRAVAAGSDHVTMLVGPLGAEAARLLPGVDDIRVWPCPWVLAEPPTTTRQDVEAAVDLVASTGADEALVFTSFHQSPLPTALLLRLAGVPRVGAVSADYPGSLLDVRHRVDENLPEPDRALSLAAACGYPTRDDGRLAVRRPLPDVRHLTGSTPYVVLHPGASVPARRWPAERFAATTRRLNSRGVRVVVTGSAEERELTALVAGADGLDLGGRTSLAETAAVLAGARAFAESFMTKLCRTIARRASAEFAMKARPIRACGFRRRERLLDRVEYARYKHPLNRGIRWRPLRPQERP